MAKDRRTLTDEEAALWQSVARSAKPLRPRPTSPSPPEAVAPRGSARQTTPTVPVAPAPKPHQPTQSLGHIDRRAVRRIARGRTAIDARLDLHGLTQAEAHNRLVQFLGRAFDEGDRVVLVITGKGAYDSGDRGVLRRALPHWLEQAPLRGLVSGYDQAHRTHGGAGAFYVRLKRRRPDL